MIVMSIDNKKEMLRNTVDNLRESEDKLHSGNISNQQKNAIKQNNDNRQDAIEQFRNEVEEEEEEEEQQ